MKQKILNIVTNEVNKEKNSKLLQKFSSLIRSSLSSAEIILLYLLYF